MPLTRQHATFAEAFRLRLKVGMIPVIAATGAIGLIRYQFIL